MASVDGNTYEIVELRHWIAELSGRLTAFAVRSERVLEALDMRAARAARKLIAELVFLEDHLSHPNPRTQDAGREFSRLLAEALQLIDGDTLSGGDMLVAGDSSTSGELPSFDDDATSPGLSADHRERLFRRAEN